MTETSATDQLSAATVDRKVQLRRELRAKRDALGASQRLAASRAIEARLAYLPRVEVAAVVHAYVGIGSEVVTEQLIRGMLARGHRLVLPRVAGPTALDHLEVTSIDALTHGPMNLREPDPNRSRPVDLAEVDAMLAPGLAFDRHGIRLGYGAGHYDRTIEELRSHGRAIVVGLTFDALLVDELPREEHDQPVDVVVTESQTIWIGVE